MRLWLSRAGVVLALIALVGAAGCARSEPPTAATPVETQTVESQEATASRGESPPSYPETGTPPFPLSEEGTLHGGKPVIYLYPPQTCEVSVRLELDGRVMRTDPPPDQTGTWRVIADPSGSLLDIQSGKRYPYLFWEGLLANRVDMSTGFVVSGAETRAFLHEKLAALGLTSAEKEPFIEYWAPRMEDNAYNLVHFEGPAYESAARLDVSPPPDTQLRVFMVFRPLDAPVQVERQVLPRPPKRTGFVLVEWGGAEVPRR